MKEGTLTQRVVWALTGSVVLFVTALVLLSYLAFEQMEDDLVDQILVSEADSMVQRVEQDPEFLTQHGTRELGGTMRAWLEEEDENDISIPALIRGLEPGLHRMQTGGESWHAWHVKVADTTRGRLYVLYDATEHEARVYEFGLIVLGIGVLCIVAAYVLSRRVANIAVGPLLELTSRLSNWAPGAADIAITRDDEAGRLVEAFNRMQNQVDRSIAREREFAANFSHEARTPLAAIRSDSELMTLSKDLPDDMKQRLLRIMTNVDHITASLESARCMASDQRRPLESVDLSLCMEDAWDGLEAMAEAAGLGFQNLMPAGVVRELDRYALLMVLRNLVRNAIEHAAPALLTASLNEAGALELRDTGKGIAPEELPFVFQRYYSGRLGDTSGSRNTDDFPRGLGLAIAKRVCDMQGWMLEVDSRCGGPGRGTRFTLYFA